jgi:hypothetical protein
VSIDERLRRGLRADLTQPRADLDLRAGRAIERGRRRRTMRRAATAIAVVAVVIGAAVAVPRLVSVGRLDRPAVSPTVAPPVGASQSLIVGTFRLFVPRGTAGAAEVGAEGHWDLVFMADGRVSLAPTGERPQFSRATFGPSSVTLSVLPCDAGPGRYGWGLAAGDTELHLSLIRDPCPLRRYVLTGAGGLGHPWFVVTANP